MTRNNAVNLLLLVILLVALGAVIWASRDLFRAGSDLDRDSETTLGSPPPDGNGTPDTPSPATTPGEPEPEEPNEVVTTDSGLQYEVLKEGTGRKPGPTDTVKVHYHGTLPNGEVFDSSVDRGEPATFPLDGVIKGWTEGLQLMKVGAKYRFTIPPELAYGESGSGSKIGPNQTLVFEVELLSIE